MIYPSTGNFELRYSETGNHRLAVYDMTGRLVIDREVNFTEDQKATFSLNTKGIYIVTVQGEKARFSQKVIVE